MAPASQTETKAERRIACPSCGKKAKRVGAATLGALLKDEFAQRFAADDRSCRDSASNGCQPISGETGWRFCDSPGCDVVYFSEDDGDAFTKPQLKASVGVKETAGERPLCYCFGHSVASIKNELRTKGRCDALDDIRAKMKDPGCHCETANPSGACCLGSVAKGIQIAQEELQMSGTEVNAAATFNQPSTRSKPAANRGELIAKVGAVISAIMASACCWLPLVLLAVGASGAGIAAAMEAYRPLFTVVTFGFLATAFYFAYRPRKAMRDTAHACCASAPTDDAEAATACCARSPKRHFSLMAANKLMLWGATALAVAFLLIPSYIGFLFGAGGAPAGNGEVNWSVLTNRAVFRIDGMTCEGCAATVAQVIRRVAGVAAVEVSYEKGEAIVGAGCCAVPKEQILETLKRAGYAARIVQSE